jgi:hypothetical protein
VNGEICHGAESKEHGHENGELGHDGEHILNRKKLTSDKPIICYFNYFFDGGGGGGGLFKLTNRQKFAVKIGFLAQNKIY